MTAIGAMVLAFFAAVWWGLGIWASGRSSAMLYLVPLCISTYVVVSALRQQRDATDSTTERARRGRLIGIASGAEGLFIFLAANVLVNLDRRDLIAPAAAIIVGLHFLPLARWLPARLYYCTSALLVALGIAGIEVPAAGQRILVVCLGAACILWLTSILLLHIASRLGNQATVSDVSQV
jgi:hypothetical protein